MWLLTVKKNHSQQVERSSFRWRVEQRWDMWFAHPPPSSAIKWASQKYYPVTPLQFMYASQDTDAHIHIVRHEVYIFKGKCMSLYFLLYIT